MERRGRRCQRIATLALAGVLAGSSMVMAGGGAAARSGEPADGELGASYIAGPARVSDPLNHLSLEVPKGWYAIVPQKGLFGSTTLANYDMGHAEDWLPEHSSHGIVKEMAKVDLTTFDLGSAHDVADWVEQRVAAAAVDGETVSTSEKINVRSAGRDGIAYVVRLSQASAVEIALPWDNGKVLLATLNPIDSVDLAKALAVVDTVQATAGESGKPEGRRPRISAKLRRAQLERPIRSLVRGETAQAGGIDELAFTKGSCTSWSGTDNGTCAAGHSCAGNASITLYLPFQWQTWWQSGGVGSFFGNFYHGNCNLDYYAIDFNQYSSSSCSSAVNDTGQNVYAAANGTAAVGNNPGGYGNYVLVTHSNGYKTRYAHLQNVNVVNGQSVTTQTIVGWVGDTGSATGAPHLHFGYQTSGVSYCNKSGGCPNGEAARSPQTQKPSPMQTNLGSRNIVDFGCNQAPP